MVYEGPGGLCVPAHPYEMPLFAASAFRCKLHYTACDLAGADVRHLRKHSYRHSSPHATALLLPDCCQGRGHIATLSGVHQFLSAAARALPAGAADCASGERRRKHHPRRERAKARWQWWQRQHFRRLLPWNHRLSSSNKRPTGCPFLGQLVQEWPPSFATQQESLKPPRFIHYHLQTPSRNVRPHHTSSFHRSAPCFIIPHQLHHALPPSFIYLIILHDASLHHERLRHTSSYIVIPTWYLGIPCGTT